MNILDCLEEDLTYEVLVLTRDGNSTHIKPFGLRYVDNCFVLDLFPGKTLLNIKKTNKFRVYFLYDALLFTRALCGELDFDSLDGSCHCSFSCDVREVEATMMSDAYGKNVITRIIAEPSKIITDNATLPIINRATNQIIELLVDFSRYKYMDVDVRDIFKEKLVAYEKTIIKTGNNKHKKALKIIKERIKE